MKISYSSLDSFEAYSLYEDTRQKVGPSKFDRLSRKKQQEEMDLNHYAKILVQAYFDSLDLDKKRDSQ